MRTTLAAALPWRRSLCTALLLACSAAHAASLLIFGETHDQPDQQRQVAQTVEQRAQAGTLAAVVIEMAERPHTTAGLPRDATEAQARAALHWQGWEWPDYAAVVMNAVRAGVPVLGGNLPRAQLRAAMQDASLDATLDPATLARIADAVRIGHCDLLPAAQLPGMVRVQIARDRAIAEVAAAAARAAPADATVLLLTGAQHAARDRGVPRQLAGIDPTLPVHVVLFGEPTPGLQADEHRAAVVTPQPDHCESLRRQLAAPKPASAP